MTDIVEQISGWAGQAEAAGNDILPETFRRWADEITRLRAALDLILAEPHGCVFCDSGKLRNPNKDHDDNCGFAAAIRAGGQE